MAKLFGKILLVILFLAGAGAAYFCPLLEKFPELLGSYAVGVQEFYVTNTQRLDSRTPSGNGEFVLRLYYPSASQKCAEPRYAYMPAMLEGLKSLKARDLPILKLFWSCFLSDIKSYAEPRAGINQDKSNFPVILFLPGIGSLSLYSYYLEQLASQGFIVAALEIPFDTEVVVFPENNSGNRVITLDPEFKHAIKNTNREKIYEYRTQAHYNWFADAQFIIEYLKKLAQNSNSQFYKKLNLDKLGALGHSHGGAVALDLAARDMRVKAGIDMDGWTKTISISSGLTKPFLFLLNQEGLSDIQDFYGSNGSTVYRCCVQGAGHSAFSDLIFLKWPLPQLLGTVTNFNNNSSRVQQEISERITQFFKTHLD